MRIMKLFMGFAAALLVVGCGSAGGGPNQPDPRDSKPAVATALALDEAFELLYMPGVDVHDLEWDVEIEYATTEVGAVFDYYDSELLDRGFARTSLERSDDEVEADYRHGSGLEIELQVELDDGRVEVDLDADDFEGPFPAGFTLTAFSGLDLPFYPDAEVLDVEWDFHFDHPGADLDAVFEYYDEHLVSLGWERTEIDDGDDDEREAEYVNEGVYLELEVEEGGEVEIEVNKLRFYAN